ncbi:MAG: hypothetical protein AAGI30_08050 [Planctomycetota bacterium]
MRRASYLCGSWVVAAAAVGALSTVVTGCAQGPEVAVEAVPQPSPAMRRFARASALALVAEIERVPAIANTSGPWAIELGPIADRTGRADAAGISRAFWLALADRVPAYRHWDGEEPPVASEPGALLLDQPGRPHRDERIFVLEGTLDVIDRVGTIDDVVYYDLRLTNAATRVPVLTVQLDSRQYGGR